MSLHTQVRQQLIDELARPPQDPVAQLNNVLRQLSKWRSLLIQNTLLQQQGTVVMSGPLRGMEFLSRSAEGCHVAKLLGCYEQPLLPHIESAIRAGYPLIVESHECLIPGITRLLIDRFAATHDISVVEDNGQRQLPEAPDWFRKLAHLDQLLAVWEWRSGPTPWLVMMAKTPTGAASGR